MANHAGRALSLGKLRINCGACRAAKEGDLLGSAAALLATSVNQDGRSSSLTAPNGPSQQVDRFLRCLTCLWLHLTEYMGTEQWPQWSHPMSDPSQKGHEGRLSVKSECGSGLQVLVASCLETAALSPEAVQYVALHGTGTPLGDPIEVGALSAALQSGHGATTRHVVAFGSNKACSC